MESKIKQHKHNRRYLSIILATIILTLIVTVIIFGSPIQNSSSTSNHTPPNNNETTNLQPQNNPTIEPEKPTISPSPKEPIEQNTNTNTGSSENTPSNPVTESNWALNQINAPAAWSESTGTGVKIAILDSGVGPIDDVKVYGGYNFVDDNEDTTDWYGHGTMVASIIAATHTNSKTGLKGVAPDAEIYAVKIIDDQGNMNLDRAIKGVQWAIDNDIQIISMSWCINDRNNALKQILDLAYSNGILLIAAAGNYGEIRTGVGCPADYDTTIAVSAVKENKLRLEQACAGSQIELTGPGENVWVIWRDNKLYTNTGTSFAAAYITGTAALVWAKNPALTNTKVRDILCQTATDLQPANGLDRDIYFGYGLVNAIAAVQITPNDPRSLV
jgi:minor extracellular protease Epr